MAMAGLGRGLTVPALPLFMLMALVAATGAASAADFCSDLKQIAAASATSFKGLAGAQTRQDAENRYFQASGWPQGATSCEVRESVTLYPIGGRYYVCKFPLAVSDKGKAQANFANQVAKCVGGVAAPYPLFTTTPSGGMSSVDAKNFFAIVETSQKSSSIELSIAKPKQ